MSSVDDNNASFNQVINEVDSIDNNSNVPDWAKVLIECVKNLINEIKSLSSLQLDRISQLEDKYNVQDVVSQNLKNENERRKEVNEMKIAVDHNEQVSRSSNLIIHGVPDKYESEN